MDSLFTVSIFYHQNEFYKILKHVEENVYPSFDISQNNIKIGDVRGSHIEMAFKLDQEFTLDHFLLLSEQLIEFLSLHPSNNKGLKKNSHELFADFPNNTIHFGATDWVVPYGYNDLSWQHNKISDIIFTIFQEYQEDTTNSLTEIGLQIIGIFCIAAKKDIASSEKFITSWIEMERGNFTNNALQNIDKLNYENYKNNRETIIFYLKELFIEQKKINERWQAMWYDLITQSMYDLRIKIDILPRLIFTNLFYDESIFALQLFAIGLDHLEKIK